MASSIPESFKIDIACPGCGKKSKQALRRLHEQKQFRCPGCGETVKITGNGLAEIDAAMKKVEQEFAKLNKAIKINLKF